MINEIPTRLANKRPEDVKTWYVDPSFIPVVIPKSIKWVHDLVVGENPEKTVPQIMTVLRCVDIQDYKSVFDSRELFDYPSENSIYDLLTAIDSSNTLTQLANSRNQLYTLFSDDDYLKALYDLYLGTNEGVVKLCAIILALAYRLKKV